MQWNLDAVGLRSWRRPSIRGPRTTRCATPWASGPAWLDPFGAELDLTTENSIGLLQRVLPTFGVVIDSKGSAFGLAGSFDPTMVVHGEQGIRLAGPLPPAGPGADHQPVDRHRRQGLGSGGHGREPIG